MDKENIRVLETSLNNEVVVNHRLNMNEAEVTIANPNKVAMSSISNQVRDSRDSLSNHDEREDRPVQPLSNFSTSR